MKNIKLRPFIIILLIGGILFLWKFETVLQLVDNTPEELTTPPVLKPKKRIKRAVASLSEGENLSKVEVKPIKVEEEILEKKPPELSMFHPLNDSVVKIYSDQKIKFIWNKVSSDMSFKLIVKDDDSNEKTYEVNDNFFEVNDKFNSNVSWSLESIENGQSTKKITGSFKVVRAEKMNIVYPLDNQTIISQNGDLTLKWSGEDQEDFLITLQDTITKKTILNKQTNNKAITLKSLPPSQYELIVESKTFAVSTPKKVQFTFKEPIGVFNQHTPFVFENGANQQKLNVKFKLNPLILKQHKKVNLEFISKESDLGKEALVNYKISNNQFSLKIAKSGNYCFKLVPEKEDLFLVKSQQLCFTYVSKNNRSIASLENESDFTTIKALPQVMTYYTINGQDSFQIKLPNKADALGYELQIFHDKDGKKLYRSVASEYSKINWKTKESGHFYYRYRVKTNSQEYTSFSNIDRLFFPISPLERW